jgi:hypothetical protein
LRFYVSTRGIIIVYVLVLLFAATIAVNVLPAGTHDVYPLFIGFGIWFLDFEIYLFLEICYLKFGAYLLFGAWDLEFITDHQNHNNLKN